MNSNSVRTSRAFPLVSSISITLATILLCASPAQALSTPVTNCGQVLNAAGQYHLTGNLGPCTGHGVVITASNVDLNLAGFTISGVSSGTLDTPATCNTNPSQIGVSVSAGAVSHVHISGGTIRGFVDGIHLQFNSNSRVNAMTLINNCAIGIAVGNSRLTRLDTNVVTGSGLDGIELGVSERIIIDSNYIAKNRRAGIGITNFANNNVVHDNILNENGGDGIAVFNGNSNTFRDNAVSRNESGIRLASSGNLRNAAISNTVNGNSSLGIYISNHGARSLVKANAAMSNHVFDLSDDNRLCATNVWEVNDFLTDQVAGVSDGGLGVGCIQ